MYKDIKSKAVQKAYHALAMFKNPPPKVEEDDGKKGKGKKKGKKK